MNVNVGLAFVAGIISFLSPCVLPLIPAYVSMLAGTSVRQLAGDREEQPVPGRWIGLFHTVLFVAGFTIVFIVLGVLFTLSFGLAGGATEIVNAVAGLIVIILGLNFMFDFLKILNIEKRVHLSGRPATAVSSFLFGTAFAAGWAPCVGPILSSILLLAGSTGSTIQGVFLLLVYSLGLGVPFLLAGAFSQVVLRQLARLRKYMQVIKIASGAFLIGLGLLIFFGKLQRFNVVLFSLASQIQMWKNSAPLLVRNIVGTVLLLLAGLAAWSWIRQFKREAAPHSGGRLTLGGTLGLHPVRLAFTLLLLVASVLTFTGLWDITTILSSWLTFQGI